MASLNKVILIGNLTRDVEVRYTPKGSAVADMAIAVNRKWRDDSGATQEEVTYVDVVVWGKTAETCGQYLSKGSPVCVEGRLQMDSWEDKATGQKRTKLRVVGEGIQFLGSKTQSEGGERQQQSGGGYQKPAQQQQQRQQQRPAPSQQDDFGEGPITPGLEDDDIPF